METPLYIRVEVHLWKADGREYAMGVKREDAKDDEQYVKMFNALFNTARNQFEGKYE